MCSSTNEMKVTPMMIGIRNRTLTAMNLSILPIPGGVGPLCGYPKYVGEAFSLERRGWEAAPTEDLAADLKDA
jgi:hypothetical protein